MEGGIDSLGSLGMAEGSLLIVFNPLFVSLLIIRPLPPYVPRVGVRLKNPLQGFQTLVKDKFSRIDLWESLCQGAAVRVGGSVSSNAIRTISLGSGGLEKVQVFLILRDFLDQSVMQEFIFPCQMLSNKYGFFPVAGRFIFVPVGRRSLEIRDSIS